MPRLHLELRGALQGVGFRPFVARLAGEIGLGGWVQNSTAGVRLEVEGERAALAGFRHRLERERPAAALLRALEAREVEERGEVGFEIRSSDAGGVPTTLLQPDLATCGDCVREIFDPQARRWLYPFTSCAACGPRFTIVESLPYDRERTSMREFPMCGRCRTEYEDRTDRRYHAQPIACPDCGPQLALWDPCGRTLEVAQAAVQHAVAALAAARVVALKGLGGFQLLADAGSDAAVRLLRQRKHRAGKPFAVLVPDLERVRELCRLEPAEEDLLLSPAAPIVLVRRRPEGVVPLSCEVAPGNPRLGVMLPYTPLHHILAREFGSALVATSGNLADEPLCTDEHEALQRLHEVADLFLVHDRPIVHHADDSVVRLVRGAPQILRRARGYVPLPVPLAETTAGVLAVGAQQKNALAVGADADAFPSQHIGDLDSPAAARTFRRVLEGLGPLHGTEPRLVAADLHPDYSPTLWARGLGLPVELVQHHHAHVAACAAENGLRGPVLGVAWDGSGAGDDGTIWGGEFLRTDGPRCERFASLRPFRLPGGERAVREPRRAALGLLFEVYGTRLHERDDLPVPGAFTAVERDVLVQMLGRGVRSPTTTSAGRLFDAIACLAGLGTRARFEGEAAMALEFAAESEPASEPWPFALRHDAGRLLVDWEPLLAALLDERAAGAAAPRLAARFHQTLAEAMVAVARRAGLRRVVLSGGCFQNGRLTDLAVSALERAGFEVHWHRQVPPNDGGLALGQLVVAARRRAARESPLVAVAARPG